MAAAAKMTVERSRRDANRLGYARHRHAVDSMLAQNKQRGVDDLRAALGLALSRVLPHVVRHSLLSLPFITEYTIGWDNSELALRKSRLHDRHHADVSPQRP
jgi:hypothetical protein